MWVQKEIRLKSRARGFHLITDEILHQLPELSVVNVGHAKMNQQIAASTKEQKRYAETIDLNIKELRDNAVSGGAYTARND